MIQHQDRRLITRRSRVRIPPPIHPSRPGRRTQKPPNPSWHRLTRTGRGREDDDRPTCCNAWRAVLAWVAADGVLPSGGGVETCSGGPATVALSIVAAVGDFRRFRHPKRLVSYLGLNPRVKQPGSHGGSPSRDARTRPGCSSRDPAAFPGLFVIGGLPPRSHAGGRCAVRVLRAIDLWPSKRPGVYPRLHARARWSYGPSDDLLASEFDRRVDG